MQHGFTVAMATIAHKNGCKYIGELAEDVKVRGVVLLPLRPHRVSITVAAAPVSRVCSMALARFPTVLAHSIAKMDR